MKPSLPLALLVLAACALIAAGCGEREGADDAGGGERFRLLLDWVPNPDHAGIFTAKANGHFSDVGLDVEVRTPSDPSAPIRQVAQGRADLAVSYTPEVLRAREQGLPVVAVGALVQKPLTSIISLPAADIREPADLRGKEVGTAGIDYQDAYLDAILEEAGADPRSVERQNVGFNLSQALLTKKVDAVLGAFYNVEGVDLERRGRDPQIINVADAGIPEYDELVLVANEDALEDDGDLVRSFLGALGRGTADLCADRGCTKADPEEVQDLLDAERGLDRDATIESVSVTLPLFQAPRGKAFGYLDPREWSRFTQFMVEAGVLKAAPEGAFTNEWLPGEGL